MSFVTSIFNSSTESGKVYNQIKNTMGATATRGKTISNNVSNFNTKGYKRFDVVLKENLDNGDLDLKRTNKKHLSLVDFDEPYKVVQDNSSSMRNDGNNVDVDIEMTNLASNTILFNSLVTEINNEFAMKSNVIRGGK